MSIFAVGEERDGARKVADIGRLSLLVPDPGLRQEQSRGEEGAGADLIRGFVTLISFYAGKVA